MGMASRDNRVGVKTQNMPEVVAHISRRALADITNVPRPLCPLPAIAITRPVGVNMAEVRPLRPLPATAISRPVTRSFGAPLLANAQKENKKPMTVNIDNNKRKKPESSSSRNKKPHSSLTAYGLNYNPNRRVTVGAAAHKRLQSELWDLVMSGDSGISAFPEEGNFFHWKGRISGSKDTVFEGIEYNLSLSFPNDYPFNPPKVKFMTCCFHPNVDVYGNICLDILEDQWSSAYGVRAILLTIHSLLGELITTSPVNPQAAALWGNKKEYRKRVEETNRSLVLPYGVA